MGKTNIMIVEDSGIVLLDIQKSLDSLGYAVVATASSKDEAIRKAVHLDPYKRYADGYSSWRGNGGNRCC